MKKLTFAILAALLAFFIIQGCNKDTPAVPGVKLQAAKTQIKVGQLDTLLLTGVAGTDSITWSVSPTGKDNLLTKKNAATIVFNVAGTYVVTAQKLGGQSSNITINVADLSAGTIPASQPDSSTNIVTSTRLDTVQIVPITTDIMMAISFGRVPGTTDSVGIDFSPYTNLTGKYCEPAVMQYKAVFTADHHFNLDIYNMRQAKGCLVEARTDITSGVGYVFRQRQIALGTYPLTVTVGSVVYTGSIIISATNVTFNWPYTSGVIIDPKVIYR